MKIVYIGKFRYSYSTEVYVEHALKQTGVEVIRQPYDCSLCPRRRWERILQVKPDIVLFSKVSFPGVESILDLCRVNGIITVCWQWDLFLGGLRSERPLQFWADHLLTTDGGHDEEWAQLGCNHSVLRQGIHEPHAKMITSSYQYDVGFVGQVGSEPSRRSLLNWLRATYPSRFVHHTQTRGMELNEALSKIKIVVGDSHPSDYYWSNRIYEITGRGGFILHPKTLGLEEDFQDGVHYVSYERGNFKQLKEKIEFYLNNQKLADTIRENGHAHCKQNLTYTHKVRELISKVTS